jgi:hypothetical protein
LRYSLRQYRHLEGQREFRRSEKQIVAAHTSARCFLKKIFLCRERRGWRPDSVPRNCYAPFAPRALQLTPKRETPLSRRSNFSCSAGGVRSPKKIQAEDRYEFLCKRRSSRTAMHDARTTRNFSIQRDQASLDSAFRHKMDELLGFNFVLIQDGEPEA